MTTNSIKEKVIIYKDLCKGCKVCINICPMGVLEIGEDKLPYLSHLKKCDSCGKCEYGCPELAISVVKLRKTFFEKIVKFNERLSYQYRVFNAKPRRKVIKLN